jgi:hypothetical protein
VLDDKTPGCADFRGNRQCISVGDVDANDRAALILMDYPNRWRLKIYAHAELRDLAEFYYWTRKLQAHFFAGDLVSAVHASLRAYRCSGRRTVSSHRTTGEATPPAVCRSC